MEILGLGLCPTPIRHQPLHPHQPRTTPTPARTTPTPAPTPAPSPVQQLPAGCTQDKVTRIGASGYDGNTVPQNVLDNNFNTRWSNYG